MAFCQEVLVNVFLEMRIVYKKPRQLPGLEM
jgi:hypothetical protein